MKMLLSFPDDKFQVLVNFLTMLEAAIGAPISAEVFNEPLPTLPTKGRGRGPSVEYAAIAGAAALEAIGATTVKGIVYQHLLNCGPCTEKQIREAFKGAYTRKSVESTLDKLKTMGVVKPQEIAAVSSAPAEPTMEPMD